MKIALMTGCNDKHYQLGLLSGLISHDIEVDFIANDDMRDASRYTNVNYFNLRGDQDHRAPIHKKIYRILKFYFELLKYAAKSDAKVFHIQWLNKFILFDRTLLNVYYKMLGKKLIFTAHNIDDRERDGNNTLINRLSLKFMYHIMDHIIVHTGKMKFQLMSSFNIAEDKVTVIPHGVHDAVFQSELTSAQARKKLGLEGHKVILFFGNIVPYKGVEYAVSALPRLIEQFSDIKLVIAGRTKNNEDYWGSIERMISEHKLEQHIIARIEYIPDEDIEVYFKAADLSILPYTYIFQSGILLLSYNFGLPVVATDVGSLREEIIEGQTGFVCKPKDPEDLAKKIARYFQSELYRNLEENRGKIIAYAKEKNSWEKIGEKTFAVYKSQLTGQNQKRLAQNRKELSLIRRHKRHEG